MQPEQEWRVSVGAENLLRILNDSVDKPKPSVEQWVESAGTVLYLAALGEVALNSPANMQGYINELVASMPETLLTVSAIRAAEELNNAKE
jgi:hypothetical protein